MAKNYKFRKPARMTGSASTVPIVYELRKTIENMNIAAKMPERVDRGRVLYLLAMANILRQGVQRKAPEIDVGGKMVDYAKELRIALVGGVRDMDAVALYFENATTELEEKRLEESALFIRAKIGSPDWVHVLVKYSPWPADMLPVKLSKQDAKVISRKAREDEIRILTERIYSRRAEIERLLSRAGAKGAKIEKSDKAIGVVIHEDVGYNVLRKEFGFDGEQQEAHWRPALRVLQEKVPFLMKRFNMYLMTGRENVFELPDRVKDIAVGQLKNAEQFQKELAPFAPGS